MSSILVPPVSTLTEQLGRVRAEVDTLASLPPTAASVQELAGLVVDPEIVQNRLAGVSAAWTEELDSAGGPEEHGAPSLHVWCRRELRVTPAETRRRTRRAVVLDASPDTKAAFHSGRVGLAQ